MPNFWNAKFQDVNEEKYEPSIGTKNLPRPGMSCSGQTGVLDCDKFPVGKNVSKYNFFIK